MSYWKNFWNKAAQSDSALMQVQRNADDRTLAAIESHICKLLNIKKTDEVLDVCCGNGLISTRIAKHCKTVVGVDFSSGLLHSAKEQDLASNIQFIEEDAIDLSNSIHQKFDKIILYYSFQYFDFKQGMQVVSEMKKLLKSRGQILIGDVPNKKKVWTYYDTLPKRFFYFKQWLFKQPKMGKFWSEKEMRMLAEENQLKGLFLQQDKKLPHAHYRFDFLVESL